MLGIVLLEIAVVRAARLVVTGRLRTLEIFRGTTRGMRFVVTSEVIERFFVDTNVPIGHFLDVFDDDLVVGMFLIVFETLRAHVAGNVADGLRETEGVFLVRKRTEHTLDVFAVVLEGDLVLRILHVARGNGQILARRTRIGRIDIQLEIRHDKQVIPQFVGEVGRIAEQRVEVAHHGNYGASLTVPVAAILDGHQRIDHLVDVSAVFGQIQFATGVVIIFFHRVSAYFKALRFEICSVWVAMIDLKRLFQKSFTNHDTNLQNGRFCRLKVVLTKGNQYL